MFLCKPAGAGAIQVDKYYFYDPDKPGIVCEISVDEVPKLNAIDDSAIDYKIPIQNGWLIEARTITGRLKRWILFCDKDEIFLDMSGLVVKVGDLDIGVFKFFCFFWVKINVSLRRKILGFWFPWHRWIFVQDSTEEDELSPFYWILKQMSAKSGRVLWVGRWSSGFFVMNEYIKLTNEK